MVKKLLSRFFRISGRRVTGEQPVEDRGERRKLERRREPRFEVPRGFPEECRVYVELLSHCAICTVRDLSSRGICFETSVPEAELKAGDEFDVRVHFGQSTLPATFRVATRRSKIVGCFVVDPDPAWNNEIKTILDPISIGKCLREIDPRYVKQDDPDLESRWFQGGAGCDLFVWSKEGGQIVRAQLFFAWQLVEWSAENGLRTGRVEASASSCRGYARSKLFELTSPPDVETLIVSRRLLAAAEAVPKEIQRLFS